MIGLVTDTWGRRRTLALLSLLMAGTGVIFGLVTSYPVLLVAAFFGTLGTSASETAPFLPIDKAMIAQVTAPECRTALFARYNLIASGSSAGGALVAGLPASTPTSIPIPTPTPRLAHSMTQVLTMFCDAITTQDDQTAWNQYARSLQHMHPQAETFAAWRKFTRCSIPDQSGDPSALTILTLTFATGYTDRFGRSGDVDYRFTMGVENQAWKITGVCDILSEGRLLCGQLGLERRMCAYERDRGESG